MIKIKNLRAGRVLITDAKLRLMPGQVVSVENITPQTQMLIDKGYVAQADPPPQKKELPPVSEGKSAQSKKAETELDDKKSDFTQVLAEYQTLNAHESVEFIKKCEDLSLLRTILRQEPRKTVLDDLKTRIKELESLTN